MRKQRIDVETKDECSDEHRSVQVDRADEKIDQKIEHADILSPSLLKEHESTEEIANVSYHTDGLISASIGVGADAAQSLASRSVPCLWRKSEQ